MASWTKTDAQKVSFAIPAQEFIHLNLSNQPMSWEQLAAIDHPAPTTRLMESRHAIDDAPEALAAGSFAAFQKKLKDSVGKSVTVVVEEEARTDIVNFIVE